jgi:signal transduction histidine kinase
MDQVLEFFRKLLDTADWPPRWHCGKWSEFHGWFYIISDLLIWSAYFAIPLVILKFITRKVNARFVRAYFLFAAFILACGATHLLDAVSFWFPAYRLNALVRFITGVVSWITVFHVVKLLPVALSLRSYEELEKEIKERELAEEKLLTSNTQLKEAQEIAKMGHWQWDVSSNELTWSEGII